MIKSREVEMRIKDILKLKSGKYSQIGNLEISDIADDSRCIGKNSLFFVIKRQNFDIFSVLGKIEKKVKAYVCDEANRIQIEKKVKSKPIIYVKDIEKCFYYAVKRFYEPDKPLKVLGVTGTNGKTSTAYFIYQLLRKMKKKAALFGTTGYYFASSKYRIGYTTADFLTLYKMIKKASQKGVEYLVMEVSSHSIAQNRIKGIKFFSCIFTNLSRDHLDYHKTMSSYFAVKKSFFSKNKSAYAVINKDCPYGRKILSEANKKISYGIKNQSDYQAKNIRIAKNRTDFDLIWQNQVFPLSLNLAGCHNILNILAALASVYALGNFQLSHLLKKVKLIKSPEGRLEEVSFDIFVDYAHTPESLKLIFSCLRKAGYQKIISVFGCGGQRDKGKRKLMGKVSSKLADFTIITSDNPRKESPLDICGQIKKGFIGNDFKIIINRREAIQEGIKMQQRLKESSGKKVCLVVAGKGHEDYQLIEDKIISFKDADIIKEFLR